MVSQILYLRFSTSEDVPLTSDGSRINSLKLLMGGIYTSIIGVNPETFTSHTLLVLRQIRFQQYKFIEIEK